MIRKFLVGLSIFTTLLFFSSAIARADIIPPDSHPAKGCARVTNVNSFPEIYLIGFVNAVSGEPYSYLIEQDKCLTQGYKFNTLDIYWTTKKYLDPVGIKNLKVNDNPSVYLLTKAIDLPGGWIRNSDPLIEEDVEYSIAGFSDNDQLVFYKSKQISKYNNGSPDKIETFNEPTIANLRTTLEPKIQPSPTPTNATSSVERNFLGLTNNLSLIVLTIFSLVIIGAVIYLIYKNRAKNKQQPDAQ